MPAKMSQFNTHTPLHLPRTVLDSTVQFSFIQFPLTYQEQPAYQQREPSPSPPPRPLCPDIAVVRMKCLFY